jgi:hypothetical protein
VSFDSENVALDIRTGGGRNKILLNDQVAQVSGVTLFLSGFPSELKGDDDMCSLSQYRLVIAHL